MFPHLRFSWLPEKSKMNSSLSVRDQQNQLLGIIHMPRELAGSWKKCCFSLPFPQIAALGKHPALKLCQPQGRCCSARQGRGAQGLTRGRSLGAWEGAGSCLVC